MPCARSYCTRSSTSASSTATRISTIAVAPSDTARSASGAVPGARGDGRGWDIQAAHVRMVLFSRITNLIFFPTGFRSTTENLWSFVPEWVSRNWSTGIWVFWTLPHLISSQKISEVIAKWIFFAHLRKSISFRWKSVQFMWYRHTKKPNQIMLTFEFLPKKKGFPQKNNAPHPNIKTSAMSLKFWTNWKAEGLYIQGGFFRSRLCSKAHYSQFPQHFSRAYFQQFCRWRFDIKF